jgi:mRNA interferase RelE/StbE
MTYAITIERRALKSLQKISKSDRTKIIQAIEKLAEDPRPVGAKKLTGRDGWRLRIGDYRVLYDITDTICQILVVDLGHRKDIYR